MVIDDIMQIVVAGQRRRGSWKFRQMFKEQLAAGCGNFTDGNRLNAASQSNQKRSS
jgi:hypothetical protein